LKRKKESWKGRRDLLKIDLPLQGPKSQKRSWGVEEDGSGLEKNDGGFEGGGGPELGGHVNV